ncbi:hypothetical protein LINPERHAP2_LOCUS12257 [Linum perenne]
MDASFNKDEPINTILTWVRLPKLPIHYFNNLAVTRIGNHIGRTVRLDLATTEGARARYARVCVEVDISKPLLRKYMIDNRIFYVEYESLENICFSCGFYGQKLDACPSSIVANEVTPSDAPTTTVPEPSGPEGDIGGWRTIQRRNKGKKTGPTPTTKPLKPTGSRFDILRHDEVPITHLRWISNL